VGLGGRCRHGKPSCSAKVASVDVKDERPSQAPSVAPLLRCRAMLPICPRRTSRSLTRRRATQYPPGTAGIPRANPGHGKRARRPRKSGLTLDEPGTATAIDVRCPQGRGDNGLARGNRILTPPSDSTRPTGRIMPVDPKGGAPSSTWSDVATRMKSSISFERPATRTGLVKFGPICTRWGSQLRSPLSASRSVPSPRGSGP
jgi:hypothetical protein